MGGVDWAIFAAMYLTVVGAVLLTKGRMRSVADYLAAGRGAGRYLLAISSGMAMVGAISIVALMESGYESGFTLIWWGFSTAIVLMLIAATGWVNYRFRRTRCLTLAEFFERRYSRRFRIFAGAIAFIAGVINFGIFPAVGARFFVYFMGLPETSIPWVMAILLATAVYFVLAGGQIAVMITDFIQGAFANIIFLVLAVYLVLLVGWPDIMDVMLDVPAGRSKVNPFDTGKIEDFNFWYFLIGMVGLLYGTMSWQGEQAYKTSAKSAHEAKMGLVLNLWRLRSYEIFVILAPIVVFTVMHHADWVHVATGVEETLAAVGSGELGSVEAEAVQNQMRGPVVLAALLPKGLFGAFAALMLGAFISTHNTYLHSWSSIFVQDVVIPFRREAVSPRTHMTMLRLSAVGVAIFIFVFSLFYKPTQAIALFFALTAAIFAGWSGAVIIFGLYTKWGHTAGAWLASTFGIGLTVLCVLLEQTNRSFNETGVAFWGWFDGEDPERAKAVAESIDVWLPNGQVVWGIAMASCAVLFVVGSVIGQWLRPHRCDLDALLHRGDHVIPGEDAEGDGRTGRLGRLIGFTHEFTRRDRVIYLLTYGWNIGWAIVFGIGTVYFLTHRPADGDWSASDAGWVRFWQTKFWIDAVVCSIVMVWFTIGGIRDVRDLLGNLRTMVRDDHDDGFVERRDMMQRLGPIVTRTDIPPVEAWLEDPSSVFNPGAVRWNDRDHLLLRVQARSRETALMWAERTADGVRVDPAIARIDGLDDVPDTIFHLYDPRLTIIDGSIYAVLAADIDGACRLCIARCDAPAAPMTLVSFDPEGDQRNGVLFPERVGGRYLRLERPNVSLDDGGPASGSTITLAESDDLVTWRTAGPVMSGRPHYWDELIGAGPPPVRTREGWLLVYHGIATHFASSNIYQAGVALLDLDDPSRILARSRGNILEPRETYELTGQVPNVVFPSGLTVEAVHSDGAARADSRVTIYYGAADTCVAAAETTVAALFDACTERGPVSVGSWPHE